MAERKEAKKISSFKHIRLEVMTEFEYLYYKTKEYVKDTETYKTKLLQIYNELIDTNSDIPLLKSTEKEWDNIFIGQIREKPEEGDSVLQHREDLHIRLPCSNNLADGVKGGIVQFLQDKNNIKEEYQLTSGTCTIYKIKCSKQDCQLYYIGQTHQELDDRLRQHLINNTAMNEHAEEEGHSFTSDDGRNNITRLVHCCNDKKRKFHEAIYIKDALRLKHSLLNVKKGDVTLELFAYNQKQKESATKFLYGSRSQNNA